MSKTFVVSIGNIDNLSSLNKISINHIIELRVDLLNLSAKKVNSIIEQNKHTFIITNRKNTNNQQDERLNFFKSIKLSQKVLFDFDIDTDLELIDNFKPVLNKSYIISYHNYDSTPSYKYLKDKVDNISKFKSKYIKIACLISNIDDINNLNNLQNNKGIIALAMGQNSEFQRLKILEHNAPFSYVSFGSDTTANGQVNLEVAETILNFNSTLLQKYAVFGSPIIHSLSPQLFSQLNLLNYHYTRIYSDNISDLLNFQNTFDLSGFNITSPLKKKTFDEYISTNSTTNQLQNCNTVKIENTIGNSTNTDYLAIIDILNSIDKKQNILILGAGASAESAILASRYFNADITVINRTLNSGKSVAEKNNIKYNSFKNIQDSINNCDVILSTIPASKVIIGDIKLDNQIIIDAVYRGSYWKELAIKFKCKYISGLLWLKYQAEYAFEYLLNKKIILDIPKNKKYTNIVLIGFMGAGKSKFGRSLGEMLDIKHYDLDQVIEQNNKLTINQIFEEYGEEYFREQEQENLQELIFKKYSIISLGGGTCDNILNKLLLTNSYVIYLYTDFETSIHRIASSGTRPQLNKSKKELIKIYEERINKYFYYSDLIIENKSFDKTINILANEIKTSEILKH
ncbi:type I 3-dehydroquinate dehydratase [Candidatus Kapabacteria bacterium]|nr:type I 3-dehydroquinate dehydratase [Candidatus Kapabacteria bacterium]